MVRFNIRLHLCIDKGLLRRIRSVYEGRPESKILSSSSSSIAIASAQISSKFGSFHLSVSCY